MTTTADAGRLQTLLRNTNATTVRNGLLQWSLRRAADALVGLPLADQAQIMALLPTRAAVAVFEYPPAPAQRGWCRRWRRTSSPCS